MATRRDEAGMTPDLRRTMLYVQKEFDRTGKPPPAQRMVGALNLKSPQAAYSRMLQLEQLGFIWRAPSGVGVKGPRGTRRPMKILKRIESTGDVSPQVAAEAERLSIKDLSQALSSALAALKPFALAGESIRSNEDDDDVAILTGSRRLTNAHLRKAKAIRDALLITLYARGRISREAEEDIRRRERAKELLEREGNNNGEWR